MPRHDPIGPGTAPELDITIDNARSQHASLTLARSMLRAKRASALKVQFLCMGLGIIAIAAGLAIRTLASTAENRQMGTSLAICGAMLAAWIAIGIVRLLRHVNGVLAECDEQSVSLMEHIEDAERHADERQGA